MTNATPWYVLFAEPIAIVVSLVLSVAVAWLTPKLAGLIGQEKANKLLASFQSSAERAAGVAFLKLGPLTPGVPPNPAILGQAVSEGVAYLKKTRPDAVQSLGADDAALPKVVEANLGKMLAKQ